MPPDASWTKVDVDHADCLFMHEVGPGSALSHVSCCFRAGGPAGYSAKNYPPGVHAAGSSTSGDSAACTRVTFFVGSMSQAPPPLEYVQHYQSALLKATFLCVWDQWYRVGMCVCMYVRMCIDMFHASSLPNDCPNQPARWICAAGLNHSFSKNDSGNHLRSSMPTSFCCMATGC